MLYPTSGAMLKPYSASSARPTTQRIVIELDDDEEPAARVDPAATAAANNPAAAVARTTTAVVPVCDVERVVMTLTNEFGHTHDVTRYRPIAHDKDSPPRLVPGDVILVKYQNKSYPASVVRPVEAPRHPRTVFHLCYLDRKPDFLAGDIPRNEQGFLVSDVIDYPFSFTVQKAAANEHVDLMLAEHQAFLDNQLPHIMRGCGAHVTCSPERKCYESSSRKAKAPSLYKPCDWVKDGERCTEREGLNMRFGKRQRVIGNHVGTAAKQRREDDSDAASSASTATASPFNALLDAIDMV